MVQSERRTEQSYPHVEKWFQLKNSISFWHAMMILHTCIAHDRRKTPIDFEVKCQGQICTDT